MRARAHIGVSFYITQKSPIKCVFASYLLLQRNEKNNKCLLVGKKQVERKGICWSYWDKLCRCKEVGGLGFRKLHNFTRSLIAKQVGRFRTKSYSLVEKLYNEKYYHDSLILELKY